jgi:hypothetical protein
MNAVAILFITITSSASALVIALAAFLLCVRVLLLTRVIRRGFFYRFNNRQKGWTWLTKTLKSSSARCELERKFKGW